MSLLLLEYLQESPDVGDGGLSGLTDLAISKDDFYAGEAYFDAKTKKSVKLHV